MVDRQGETVPEFFVNPKPCHDINAQTEPTGCHMLLQLAVDTKTASDRVGTTGYPP